MGLIPTYAEGYRIAGEKTDTRNEAIKLGCESLGMSIGIGAAGNRE
jgi:hypothetical protein